MPDLSGVDCRKTYQTPNRSDVPMGINAILMAGFQKIRFVNMSDNFLAEDGARAFASFLEISKCIRKLIMNNCGMEAKSCEMISEAISKNKDVKLVELQAAKNKFGKEGFELLLPGLQ